MKTFALRHIAVRQCQSDAARSACDEHVSVLDWDLHGCRQTNKAKFVSVIGDDATSTREEGMLSKSQSLFFKKIIIS